MAVFLSISLATCFTCKEPGHIARDCPSEKKSCYTCGRIGHISFNCPERDSDDIDRRSSSKGIIDLLTKEKGGIYTTVP